jgi:hypothetical protein
MILTPGKTRLAGQHAPTTCADRLTIDIDRQRAKQGRASELQLEADVY